MPFMTFQTTKVTIDITKFNQTLDTAIQTQLRQGVRAWLREIIKHIPIWTGTSMATFSPLAATLRVAIPSNYEVVRPGYGASVGRAAQTYEFGRVGNSWFFEFTQELSYFLLNENFDMSAYIHLRHKTPWHAMKSGDAVFEDYINKNLKGKLPGVDEFLLLVQSNKG